MAARIARAGGSVGGVTWGVMHRAMPPERVEPGGEAPEVKPGGGAQMSWINWRNSSTSSKLR